MLFTCCFFCQRLTLIVCGFDACGCYLSNSTHLILASCNGNRFVTSVFELNRNVCLYVQDLNHFGWHWNLNFQCSLSPTKLSLWAFFKKMNLFSIFGHSIWFMGLNIFMLEIKKWKVIRCDPTQIYITFFKYLLNVLNSKIMLPSFKKLNGFCTTSQNFINYSINLYTENLMHQCAIILRSKINAM